MASSTATTSNVPSTAVAAASGRRLRSQSNNKDNDSRKKKLRHSSTTNSDIDTGTTTEEEEDDEDDNSNNDTDDDFDEDEEDEKVELPPISAHGITIQPGGLRYVRQPRNLPPRKLSSLENKRVNTYTPIEESKDWLKEYLSTIKPTDKLLFHVLYETGLSPQTNVSEIFESNFMPMNGRQYNPRFHHRRNGDNTINYYTPDVTRFKKWITEHPPDEEQIVDILTLQDYIQCVLKAMFDKDFPDEKQKPALFYTSISYLAWRSSKDYNNIDDKYKSNEDLRSLWRDLNAIKIGASNDFIRFIRKMRQYISHTSYGMFNCVAIGVLPGSNLSHYDLENLLHFRLIKYHLSGEWFDMRIRDEIPDLLRRLGFRIIFKGVHKEVLDKWETRTSQSTKIDTLYLIKPRHSTSVIDTLTEMYDDYVDRVDSDMNKLILRFIVCIMRECKIGSTEDFNRRKKRYIWSRTNNGWVAYLLKGEHAAAVVEKKFGNILIKAGERDGKPTDLNRRWIRREWFLIGRGEMRHLLEILQTNTNPNVGEIIGPLHVSRSGALVAATTVPEDAVRQYIERGYITEEFLVDLLEQNIYILRH
jgi:hypothetical protein